MKAQFLLGIILALFFIPFTMAIYETQWYANNGFHSIGTYDDVLNNSGVVKSTAQTKVWNESFYAGTPGDYAETTTPTLTTGAHDISASYWANSNTSSSGLDLFFLELYSDNNAANHGMYYGWEDNKAGMYGYANSYWWTGSPATINTWHFYCYAWNSATQTINLYADGVNYNASTALNQIDFPTPVISMFAPVAQNQRASWQSTGYFDDVRIFDNKILTPEECELIYNAGSGTMQSLSDMTAVLAPVIINATMTTTPIPNALEVTLISINATNATEVNATLYRNGTILTTATYALNNGLFKYQPNITLTANGNYILRVNATDGGSFTRNSFTFIINGIIAKFPLNGTNPRDIQPSHLIHYWSMNQTGMQDVMDEGIVPINLTNEMATFQTEFSEAYLLSNLTSYVRNYTYPTSDDGFKGNTNWSVTITRRLDRLEPVLNKEQCIDIAADVGGATLIFQDSYLGGGVYGEGRSTMMRFNTNSTDWANDTTYTIVFGEAPAIGEWHRYTLTRDDTGLMKAYVDGILTNVSQHLPGVLQPQYGNVATGVELTGHDQHGTDWQFVGGIQNVAFWNITLTLSEVQQLSGINPCTPDYVCNGYASCNITDTRDCNSVTDLNTCGSGYTGNYSEFNTTICNYCTSTYSTQTAACVSGFQNITYTYTNNCCTLTSLPSDCNAPANSTNSTCTSGGYVAQYSANDIAPVVIDTGLKMGVGVQSYISIFVFALVIFAAVSLIVWAKWKKKK